MRVEPPEKTACQSPTQHATHAGGTPNTASAGGSAGVSVGLRDLIEADGGLALEQYRVSARAR